MSCEIAQCTILPFFPGQVAVEAGPDALLHFCVLQVFLGDPEEFPGQMGYAVLQDFLGMH